MNAYCGRYLRFSAHGMRNSLAIPGIYLECKATSLTSDIPLGLGWIIEAIIRKLPRESLINTLRATRDALSAAQQLAENLM